jgi:hypothetical protein
MTAKKNMIQWICSQHRRITGGITENRDSRNFVRALLKTGKKEKRLQIRNARIADQPNASKKIPTRRNFSVQFARGSMTQGEVDFIHKIRTPRFEETVSQCREIPALPSSTPREG